MKVINTHTSSAEKNMRIDEELLLQLDPNGPCILHFYEWRKKSATYGYFIRPDTFIDLKEAEKENLSLARRPTGGGVIFHIWDFAFSVLVPSNHRCFSKNTLDNYRMINSCVLDVVKEFLSINQPPYLIDEDVITKVKHFCMAKPTKYDVLLKGKKIAGASQRQRKNGFLHQGSLSMIMPNREFLTKVLINPDDIVENIFLYTYPLLGLEATIKELKEAKKDIRHLIEKYMRKYLEEDRVL